MCLSDWITLHCICIDPTFIMRPKFDLEIKLVALSFMMMRMESVNEVLFLSYRCFDFIDLQWMRWKSERLRTKVFELWWIGNHARFSLIGSFVLYDIENNFDKNIKSFVGCRLSSLPRLALQFWLIMKSSGMLSYRSIGILMGIVKKYADK